LENPRQMKVNYSILCDLFIFTRFVKSDRALGHVGLWCSSGRKHAN